MGVTLLKYYKYMGEEQGIDGKVKLAQKTKMTSTIAASVPDSAENIRKVQDAVQAITGKPAPLL
jgi:hypothetical protein